MQGPFPNVRSCFGSSQVYFRANRLCPVHPDLGAIVLLGAVSKSNLCKIMGNCNVESDRYRCVL